MMSFSKKTLIVSFIGLMTVSVFSQQKTISLYSEILEETRIINIYFPLNYEEHKELDYPTIYLFDGSILFDYLVGLYKYNSDYYPPAIIVGVNQIDRNIELGVNTKFTKFFIDELILKIDSEYRTNCYKLVIGHSLGGAFVLNSALKSKKVNNVISISSTIKKKEFDLINIYNKEYNEKSKLKIYIGYGDNDFEYLMKDSDRVYDLLNKEYSKLDVYKDEDHNSAILIGIRKGLDYFFKDLIFPEYLWNKLDENLDDSIFKNYFITVSNFYNCKIHPLEDDFNRLGYLYLSVKNIDKALSIFKKNIKLYPNSSNVYDSYAECLETFGQFKLAKKYYKKAISIEKKNDNDHYQLLSFKSNYNRICEKINLENK